MTLPLSRRTFLRRTAIVGAGAVAFAACGSSGNGNAQSNGGGKGRPQSDGSSNGEPSFGPATGGYLYYPAIVQGAIWYVSEGMGFWEEEGFESASALEITSPQDGFQSLGGDIMFTNPSFEPPVTAWFAGSTDLRVISPLFMSTVTRFGVPADSSIESPADLAGKTIGITVPNASVHNLARKMLAAHDVPEDEVEFVSLNGYAGVQAALLTKQVDVGGVAAPAFIVQQNEGTLRQLYDPTELPGFQYCEGLLATTKSLAEENPDYMEAVVRVFKKTNDLLANDKETAAAIWAEGADYPEDVALATLEAQADGAFSSKTDWGIYASMAEQMDRNEQIPEGKVPWEELFTQEFMDPEDTQEIPSDIPFL